MDDVVLTVRPMAAGWFVEGSQRLETLAFFSGAKAEAQAHALAKCMADLGRDARVLVQDRAEQIIGSTRYFARDS